MKKLFLLVVGAILISGVPLTAATFNADFNTGAVPAGSSISGSAAVNATGGYTNSGGLRLTEAVGGQVGGWLINDFSAGAAVNAFNATFKVELGNGTTPPADGFSFNWATNLTGAGNEEGEGNGLIIAFDTFDNGSAEAPAIDIKWQGNVIAHSTVPFNFSAANAAFVTAQVTLANGAVTVLWNGATVHSNVGLIGFGSFSGAKFSFVGRTGGATERHYLDDVSITTTPGSGSPTSFALRKALQTDTDANGKTNPGDILRYTITLTNTFGTNLLNAVLTDTNYPNQTFVGGSLKATPLARADAPATNSVPGNAFHGSFNTTLNVPAVSGLLLNDFLGLPAAQIVSFGGGVFGGSVTAHAAGTTAVASGVGSLTVNTDGSLTFAPATGFNGLITFQYRLTNSSGFSDATSQMGIGTRPNTTNVLAFVTGNTLLDSALIPYTVLTNAAGNGIGISGNTAPAHGTASVAANGQFTYNPAPGYTGSDSFTYTLTNGFGSSTGTMFLTVANKLWYIDNSVAANGDGRSSSPFKQTSDFTTANDGAAGHPADNDLIFLRQGSSNYTGSTSLRAGQKLIGDGASGTFSSLFGFTLAAGSAKAAGVAVPALTGTRPFISIASGTGVSLNSSNTVLGLNVHSANGRAFSGASVGLLVINNVTASATGDRALNLNSGNVNVTLDSVSATNSVDTGITLAALSGTVAINGGFITGAGSTDFQVSGGSATISFAGAINNSAGRSVDINGTTGGGVTLSGNLTDTGTGLIVQNCTGGNTSFTGASKSFSTATLNAITFSNNTTMATFNGGLVVNTTSGAAVSVAGRGTFTVNGVGNIFTTGAGPGLLNTGSSNTTTININASMTSTGGPIVTILNRTGGGVVLSGTLTNTSGSGITVSNVTAASIIFNGISKSLSTGANTAVNLVNNTGTQITFDNGGLAITTTSGTGFSVIGGGFVIVNFANNIINTTTGTAFLNSGTGGSAAINMDAGLVSTAGRLIDIQNRTTNNVTLSGSLNNTGGTGMLVQNNSGGTNFFGGPVKTFSTGANTAVNLVNNSGATITFQSQLAITTTSGTGFNATGGGTVIVLLSGPGNTITSGTGTALNVVNTTIGASGLSFRSISANGASSGIVLNTTGGSGSLSVTGNGPPAVGGDNSGGTIQNTSSHGISLNATLSPSFANMNIHDTGGSGINGTAVTNFTFTSGKIINSGNALGESAIAFNGSGTLTGTNIVGTMTVGNCILTNAFDCGIHVENTAGTINDLVITNNAIASATTTNTSKGDGIRLVGTGNATTVGSLMKAGIRNNTVRNFPSGAGIQLSYGNTHAAGPLGTCGIPNDAANLVVISGNICRGASPSIPFGKNAIAFGVSGGNSGQRSRGNFNVANNGTVGNPIGDCFNIAVQVLCLGYATMTATVDNNVVVANNALGSGGIAGGNSFLVNNAETPDLTLTVINNNISQVDGNGILLFARGTTSTMKLGIRNNTVAAPLGGVRPGIRVDAGNASSFDDAVCLDISGNVTAGSSNTAGIGLRKQGTISTTHDFSIEGMAAAATPGIEQYVGNGVGGKNPGSANGVGDGSVNGVLLISAGSGFSNCSTAP